MRTRDDFHGYQETSVEFVTDMLRCALFVDMGLGKTVIALTAIKELLDDFAVTSVLVIAPLRVANTVWKQEAEKWEHTKDLDIGICTGTEKQRRQVLARKHDITVINRENVAWLRQKGPKWRWDMIVIDESSSFKSYKSKRFKALRSVLKVVNSMVLLTGTPSPNGYMDLWPQLFLIDRGERLFKTITQYRDMYFNQGYNGYTYTLRNGADDQIQNKITDVCMSLSAEDYLDMPDKISYPIYVEISDALRDQYNELKKESFLEIDESEITAVTAAVLINKLLQFTSGCIYDEDGDAHIVHDVKIDALRDIIEDNPSENILVAYNYRTDLERLQKAFPQAVTLSKDGREVEDWNAGKIPLLLAHPASAGHGLNLQHGGSIIVWFALNHSLELYQQFNARLYRQGQTKPVRIIHLIILGTADEGVMAALETKAESQFELLEYIRNG